jgi:hypothetical protein
VVVIKAKERGGGDTWCDVSLEAFLVSLQLSKLFSLRRMGRSVMSGRLSSGKARRIFSLFCFLFLLLRLPLQAAEVTRELLLHIRFLYWESFFFWGLFQ